MFFRPVDSGDNGDKQKLRVETRSFLQEIKKVNYLAAFFLAIDFLIFLASSVSLLLDVDSR